MNAQGTGRGATRPDNEIDIESQSIKIKTLGEIIGAFKTVSAKQINIIRNSPGISIWQRDFYEHIGRNENELFRIRQYIINNPIKWNKDNENPQLESPEYVAMPNPKGTMYDSLPPRFPDSSLLDRKDSTPIRSMNYDPHEEMPKSNF